MMPAHLGPDVSAGYPVRRGMRLAPYPDPAHNAPEIQTEVRMLFMVIERFKDRDPIPVYRRVRDPGIKFPEGLKYLGSWIEPNFDRCFQLMECDDARLLQQWILSNARDTGMTFEIVPVVTSAETREVVAPYLDGM